LCLSRAYHEASSNCDVCASSHDTADEEVYRLLTRVICQDEKEML
jgi:hypothetical protein